MGVTVTDKSSLCFPVTTEITSFQEKVHPFSNVRNILKTRGIPSIPSFLFLSVQDIKPRYSGASPMATKPMPLESFLTKSHPDTP